MDVKPVIDSPYEFHMELRSRPDSSGTPFYHEVVNDDLSDLIEETFVRGVLGELFPAGPPVVHCAIRPVWSTEPAVGQMEIELSAAEGGEEVRFRQRYASGRWTRRAITLVQALRDEQSLGKSDPAYILLFAEKNGTGVPPRAPELEAPEIVDQSLEDFGIRGLGEGSLVPDRPILLNSRTLDEVIELCRAAGAKETGAALLGKVVRLPEALPGTGTHVVTILSTSIADNRHAGALNEFKFNPEALVEAARVAELREKGERVISVVHTHGWGTGCDECNQNEKCPLAECSTVSVLDYQLIESLFPNKATVMPVAGRKLGAPGKRPVLEIHAWRGGELKPVRWQQYHD